LSVIVIERPIRAGVRGEHDAAIGQDKRGKDRQSDTLRKDGSSVERKTKIGGQTESSGQKETKRGSRRAREYRRQRDERREKDRRKWQDKISFPC